MKERDKILSDVKIGGSRSMLRRDLLAFTKWQEDKELSTQKVFNIFGRITVGDICDWWELMTSKEAATTNWESWDAIHFRHRRGYSNEGVR